MADSGDMGPGEGNSSPGSTKKRAPAVIRNAWSKADDNAQIRRTWPTMAALDKAAAEGFFDDLRTIG